MPRPKSNATPTSVASGSLLRPDSLASPDSDKASRAITAPFSLSSEH